MKPYIAQIKSNLRLMGRDRAVLFFTLLFPLTLFFLFAQLSGGAKDPGAMANAVIMVIVIGLLGNGLFGAGMRTVQERETNILRRFKVAPITPVSVLIPSLVSGAITFLPTTLLFYLIASAVYGMPLPRNLGSVLLLVLIGVLAFRSIGVIVAAVVNSAAEAQILVQLLYLPMLFLSGATFPVTIMPDWVQVIAGFLPATYMYQGLKELNTTGASLASQWSAILGLCISCVVSLFMAAKLFRWEKEEKIAGANKAWIAAALAPFFVLGTYQGHTKENIRKAKVLSHLENRKRVILFTNIRIFAGDGWVIPNGAVLMRDGKIAEVYRDVPHNTKALNAEVWNESGRTLLPGLIDMHVHIGASGGVYKDASRYADPTLGRRRLAAYLFSGITAVRSVGDSLDSALQLRDLMRTSEYLGAEFFTYGPLFTAPDGHPSEMLNGLPPQIRDQFQRQFLRTPTTVDEARRQVDELKIKGVDGIKAVLESGSIGWGPFPHLRPDLYSAIIDQAQHDSLPTATHTGSLGDVQEAVAAGTNTLEHGTREAIPASVFESMKAKNIAYDPTLSIYRSLIDISKGDLSELDRSLIQQAVPSDLLHDTKEALANEKRSPIPDFIPALNKNLLDAYNAGVPLIAGSDAGNMLVFHGPTIQRELALWVKAGVPAGVALQAATHTAAKYLHQDNRIGLIAKGHDATFILVDGDPVQDISALERLAEVFFQGEQVTRYKLLPDSQ